MGKVKLSKLTYMGLPFYYRTGTSDEKAYREVIVKQCYCRKQMKFWPREGERWLDLGGNIGAFALYCRSRGATCTSYEPDQGNFAILQRNIAEYGSGFIAVNQAVTTDRGDTIPMWVSTDPDNHYRNTVVEPPPRVRLHKAAIQVPNLWVGHIRVKYDGVKMDIEGSELDMIDTGLIPKCDRLCLEYHSSRDRDLANLKRRLDILKSMFRDVRYQDYDNAILHNDLTRYAPYDRVVFCQHPV